MYSKYIYIYICYTILYYKSHLKWLFSISAASLQPHCNMASDNPSRKHGAASAPSMLVHILDTQDNHISPATQLPSRQNVLPQSMEQNYPHPCFVVN